MWRALVGWWPGSPLVYLLYVEWAAGVVLHPQGAQFIIIPTANGYPTNYNPIANILVPAR